jgi:uncharacterized coiled-coil protein SlyX
LQLANQNRCLEETCKQLKEHHQEHETKQQALLKMLQEHFKSYEEQLSLQHNKLDGHTQRLASATEDHTNFQVWL